MAEDSGEKSIDPSPHRRQQARDEGQVARSQDLSSAGLLLGGLAILIFTGGALLEYLVGFLSSYLGGKPWMDAINSGTPTDVDLVTTQWNVLTSGLAKVLLPVLGLVTLLAIGLNLVQTGFLFLPGKLMPDASRINPLTGLGRMVSLSSAMRLAFGIFKIGVIAAVTFVSVYDRRHELIGLAGLDLPQIAIFAWEACFWTSVKIGIALMILAVVDYGYQRWKYEQDLKMTPQEMREEMRNLQGDPQVTARRRTMQRQMAAGWLATAIPKADVVIATAADLMVALRYDANRMTAPTVVAKGTGEIAARIRSLAQEHNVPIVEKQLLAQALFKKVDMNQPIPDPLYAELAEVLAYVYQLKSQTVAA